jgi:hypothetical protein
MHSHAQELIQMPKGFGGIARWVEGNTTTKCMQWQEFHDLRENKFADEHWNTGVRKTQVPQIRVQVGNTPKIRFRVVRQGLALCH